MRDVVSVMSEARGKSKVLVKSVILSGPRDGGPYKREDFLGPEFILQGKVKDLVITFGPQTPNGTWF